MTGQTGHLGRLEDIVEPDDNLLRETEAESTIPPVRRAIVVLVSDSAMDSDDRTGDLVTELLSEDNFEVDGVVSVAAKRSTIRKAIETAVVGGADLVVTIGGTGAGPRNKTPDATRAVLDQILPGIAQALRASGLACGAIDACTSRGIAGVSGSTVIVNLAPSRAAIRDGMATLGPLVHHVIDQLQQWTCD